MRRILVANDLTDGSKRAVQTAVELVARPGDLVRVLHVVPSLDPRGELFHDFTTPSCGL